MADIDSSLVTKGRREPRAALLEQIPVSLGLAKTYAKELEGFGFTAEDTAELEQTQKILESELAAQVESKDEQRQATASVGASLSKAKQLKRRLDRAVSSMFRREKNVPVTRDAFEAGGKIGDSVSRMLLWLTKVEAPVKAALPLLKKRLGGIDPVAAIAESRAALESTNTAQELAIQDAPQDTLRIYEAKGRALLLIEDLNEAGRNAFDEDAPSAAKFNKDILVRARRRQKAEPVKDPKVA